MSFIWNKNINEDTYEFPDIIFSFNEQTNEKFSSEQERNIKSIKRINNALKKEYERRLKREKDLFIKIDETIDFINIYKKSKKIDISFDNELKTVFSIAKAELSQLTYEDAKEIYNKYKNTLINENDDEFLMIIKKEIIDAKEDIDKISYIHDKLEFYNVLNAIKYIRTSNKKLYKEVKRKWIDKELLLKLHTLLTNNMDELFLDKNIKHYSPYFTWRIRDRNNIQVWWFLVKNCNLIEEKIKEINKLSLEVKDFSDIWNIHWEMYITHIFSNGNKRVSRCVEMILIRLYFPQLDNFPLSSGYFFNNNIYLWILCDMLIRKNNIKWWKLWHQWFLIISIIEFIHEIFKIELDNLLLENNLKEFINNIPYQNIFRKEYFVSNKYSFIEFEKKMLEKEIISKYNIWYIINNEKINKELKQSIQLIRSLFLLIWVNQSYIFWEKKIFYFISND